MAEFDPIRPHDATEAAYRDALLADEAGREQRRARLMAALPRPEVAVPVPVARDQLSWRWQPYALGVLAMGLLLAGALALKGRRHESKPEADPRLAAGPAASAPVVVAQADRVAEVAPAAARPPVADKALRPKLRAMEPVVVADAAPAMAPPPVADKAVPPKLRTMEPVVVAEVSPSSSLRARYSEAAPVAVPPPAAVIAAAPPPPAPAKPISPAAPLAAASNDADLLERVEASGARAKTSSIASSLAASGTGELRAVRTPSAADAALLKAVLRSDPEAARAALQAGASVHQRDALGRTMLMLAAHAGAREMVDVLLAAGARRTDLDAQGWTAAEHARDQGHEDLAERLR